MPVISNISFKNHAAFDNLEIKFTPSHATKKDNFFTMIIGENGTGKSELLKSIVNSLRKVNTDVKNLENVNISISDPDNNVQWPEKIIASTFSVNDKLPFIKSKLGDESKYYYGGMRTTSNSIFISNYKSELFSTFHLISLDKKKDAILSDFFKKMDLPKTYKFEFSLTFEAKRQLRKVTPKEIKFVDEAIEYLGGDTSELNSTFGFKKVKFTDETLLILKDVSAANNLGFSDSFSVVTNVIYDDVISDKTVSQSLKTLLDARIIGITSFKDASDEGFLTLSSGQFNLIRIFSSIICEIQSNSLLIIDEPEISLHPSWQVKYIDMLRSVMQNYIGCHVLIATHSHLLITSLPLESSNILVTRRVNDKIVIDELAVAPSGWSSDMLLYTVFGVLTRGNQVFENDLRTLTKQLSKWNNDSETLKNYKEALSRLNKYSFPDEDPITSFLESARKTLKEKE